MGDTNALFSASLISPDVSNSFPDGFVIRPLERGDYSKGFLDCMKVLTYIGDVTEAEFLERYDEMVEAKGTYYFLVIEHQGRIVGTGALVVEKKFIHQRGKAGHIEEISIAKEHQKKGLGLKMIQALDSVAVNLGCYKNILNCGAKNEPFYKKCGFGHTGLEMSHYFEEERDEYRRG
ncbi:acyl-CoA N-acyltransferase [Hypoxylon trugodes]|uniref:acyl-CoA N-acyltransferase n=1 Tax=Hypoxylon trugodes TaxID=326681 RepID=UPI00219779F8|nr:acyl-CoA N-acyltransferase [Hypoxylon trugodes]KAI1383978.1 acyl-CoA N-acyltransferase [Hypoxylon trugodes]